MIDKLLLDVVDINKDSNILSSKKSNEYTVFKPEPESQYTGRLIKIL